MSEITYIGAHMRVWRSRGKASGYTCTCGAAAKEWAYTHDTPCPNELTSPLGQKYSTDISKYVPLCFRCHRTYDNAEITHCPQGHEYAGDNLIYDGGNRKCKTCVYKRNNDRRKKFGMTPEQKARKVQLQRERRATQRELAEVAA
jgi:hypothetical protein